MTEKKRYTDIVFDIDGTLLDTERTGVLSLLQTVKELTGREMSYEEGYSFFGTPSARASEVLGFGNIEMLKAIVQQYNHRLINNELKIKN